MPPRSVHRVALDGPEDRLEVDRLLTSALTEGGLITARKPGEEAAPGG